MRTKLLTILMAIMATFGVQAYAQDASLYQKYANKGDADAMYNLAGCYWSGTGGASQDYPSAAYWYEKAAKKNNLAAMHMTAFCYLYGVGVNLNWKTAWDYAEKAIKKGFGPANWIKAQIFKEGYMSNASGGYTRFLAAAAESGYAKAQTELGLLYLYGSSDYHITQSNTLAFNWLKKAADNEDAEGLYYLGACYDAGVGTIKNHDKALEYYGKAAQLGDANAQAAVGYAFLIGDTVNPDYSTAYDYLKAAAEQDNAYAYGKIGDMYYYGLGVEENNNTAMDMYKKAVELGDAYSMCQLAYMYGYGIGASEDNALMFKYYKQAADLEYAAGQCGLGDCYLNGYGVAKNAYTAFSLYKKAADQDNNAGLYRLATCYLNGEGTTKNISQYIEYLKKAANNGYVRAMSSLAYEYYSGENVSGGKNLTKATEWFKKAAENDDVYSQAMLGYCYYKGEELFSYKDYNQAFQYLFSAAKNSNFEYLDDSAKADVYHFLAGCYRYGRGTDADQSLASYYTEQAAKYGNVDSQRASGLLRKAYDYDDSSIQSQPVISNTGNDSNNSASLNQSSSRAEVKPAQNGNWEKLSTSTARDCYNSGFASEKEGNYKKAFECYEEAYNGGVDLAATKIASAYAYGIGVAKNIEFAYRYINIALKNFKEKELVYPLNPDYWYDNVLNCKGEICVIDNNWDDAKRIYDQLLLTHSDDPQMVDSKFFREMRKYLSSGFTYVYKESSKTTAYANTPITVSVPSNRIDTDTHKWEVSSIEIRDNCTYVYKRVTPKNNSTWVSGDTSEFIEDAQTGEKYYLTDSTLGLMPKQTILKGTTPRDFTETYPALPSSVRFINISSGSTYYVRNLKIR